MRAAWLEIDLDAYRRNLRALRDWTERPVLAVVKANGYGHGLGLVAAAARDAGCPAVGVALPEEGAELRSGGLGGRIIVLGLSLEEQAGLVLEHDLEPVVSRVEVLQALAEAARSFGKQAAVHVKVDTGMSRVGVAPEEAAAFCRRVAENPHLRFAGLMTHFAGADEECLESTRRQWELFAPLAAAEGARTPRPILHAANSAAALWFPPARLDWVRGGLVTYGVPPGPRPVPFPLLPVASLHARVVQLKEVPAGCRVSYGGTWRAPRPSRLALVPLGYGDGLPWSLSNRGAALLQGRRVPFRGRVCMDQVVLDVTDLPSVEPGESAVFLGKQGNEEITVGEVAREAGSIPYEILTRLAARLPRVPRDHP